MTLKQFWNERLNYRNRGTDARPLGRVGGLVQGLLSLPFDWLHSPPVKLLQIQKSAVYLPPFIAINIRQGGRWRTFRAGWRWDNNYRGYIADVIVKMNEDNPQL